MADEENRVQDKPMSEDGLGNEEGKENGVGKSPEKRANSSLSAGGPSEGTKEHFGTRR